MSIDDQIESDAGPETMAPTKSKPKTPWWRMAIWLGALAGMIVLAVFELKARGEYSATLKLLKKNHEAAEDGDFSKSVTVASFEKFMKGSPDKKTDEIDQVESDIKYDWSVILKDYSITLRVNDDDDPSMLWFETGAKVAPSDSTADSSSGPGGPSPDLGDGNFGSETASADGMDPEPPPPVGTGGASGVGPPGEGGGGGGGSGRRNFDPFQFDKDKDDKISLEEAPEWMKRFFDAADADKDGFIDKEEWEKRRAQRGQRGQRGGGPGGSGRPQRPGGSGRNQRPASDDSFTEPANEKTKTEKSKTEKPDADKPDADKPDAAKPDAAKPDAAKPDADKPDAAKPATDKK
jgi:hypothetical protein